MVGLISIFPDIWRRGEQAARYNHHNNNNNGKQKQPYGCMHLKMMALRKMYGLTGGVFLMALLLHVVPATTEMEYFPGLRRPPGAGLSNWPQPPIPEGDYILHQLSTLIEEQARRRFQQQLATQQYYASQHHRPEQSADETNPQRMIIEPGFTYQFPESPVNLDEPIQFAVNPSDPRYHETNNNNNYNDIENPETMSINQMRDLGIVSADTIQSADANNEEHLISKPAEDVPYYKLKPPMEVNPKVPLNNIRDDLKALLEKLQQDGKANTILNNGGLVAGVNPLSERSEVVKKPMGMDDSLGMYIVALIAGISAAVTVGLIALIIAWYTLHKKAKAAADVEYPAYGVTGPNKDISPSGDRRLAQSAQMYHYQHQKQQIIAMENRTGGDNPGGISDVESDDDNEEGDYTVYECPGLAPTGEMEVKNPLFLDDTPVTPSSNTGDSQQRSSQKQQTPKKQSVKQQSDTGKDTPKKPDNKEK